MLVISGSRISQPTTTIATTTAIPKIYFLIGISLPTHDFALTARRKLFPDVQSKSTRPRPPAVPAPGSTTPTPSPPPFPRENPSWPHPFFQPRGGPPQQPRKHPPGSPHAAT